MISEQNLIEICTISLTCADQNFLASIASIMTDPHQLSLLKSTISNPYVAFSFCLAIKNKINMELNCVSRLLGSYSSSSKEKDCDFKNIAQIACQTDLFQKLKNQPGKVQKCSQISGDYFSAQKQDVDTNFPIKMSQSRQTQSVKWYENIIYLDLLLTSFCLGPKKQLSGQDLKWSAGLQKLRDQLIGTLSLNILIDGKDSNIKRNSFETIIKIIKDFAGNNQLTKIYKISKIINQMIMYVQKCHCNLTTRIFCYGYGRKLMIQTLASLNELKDAVLNQENILLLVLQMFDQFYILMSNSQQNKNCLNIDSSNDQQSCQSLKNVVHSPQWLIKFDYKLIQFILSILSHNSPDSSYLLIRLILQVIQKMATHHSLKDDDDFQNSFFLKNEQKIKYEKTIFQCMTIIMINWLQTTYGNLDSQRSLADNQQEYYMQTLIIESLSSVFNFFILFAVKQQILLIMALQQFSPAILQKIPIKIQSGFQSPIPRIFDFLYNFQYLLNQIRQEKVINAEIVKLINLFMMKCIQQVNKQQFINFKQENQSISDFFDPILQLVEKLQNRKCPHQVECYWFINLLKQKLTLLFRGSISSRNYLIYFAIQSVKNIQEGKNIKLAQQKCKLIMQLLQILPSTCIFSYLRLLDVITDQLIGQDAFDFDQSVSFLWYYLHKNTSYTFNSFVAFISSQILKFLLNSNSNYYAHYAIHLLARLCSRYRNTQKIRSLNDKKQNRLSSSQSLKPVFGFIRGLQKTVLNNLSNYQQRVKLFEIIGLISVNSIDDIFRIYNCLIRPNVFKNCQVSKVHYLMDVVGLLSATYESKINNLLIQLICKDLNENENILLKFTPQNLSNQQIYFQLFTDFLLKFIISLQVQKMNQFLLDTATKMLKPKLDLLSVVWTDDNFDEISDIYLAYSQLSIINQFPKLSQCLYRSLSTIKVVQFCFQNLDKIQSEEQLIILYRNVFQREFMQFGNQIPEDFKQNLIDILNLPRYIFLLAQQIDFRRIRIFFNYQNIIQKILLKLFQTHFENYSFSATKDSQQEIDSDSDYDLSPTKLTKHQLGQTFFISDQYKTRIIILAKAQLYFEEIEGQMIRNVDQFESNFIKAARQLIVQENK